MIEDQRKPRQRRKEARPGEILDAAFEEFALSGFAATKLDDVAARAGITKGTIYLYYASKEELFVATFKEMVRPVMENIASLTERLKGPAMDILRAHFRIVYDHMVLDRRGRELQRMLAAEGGRFPDLTERWHDEVIGPAIEQLRAVLRYGVERGEFRPVETDVFCHIMISPVLMASNWYVVFGDSRPLDLAGFYEAHLDTLGRTLLVSRGTQDC